MDEMDDDWNPILRVIEEQIYDLMVSSLRGRGLPNRVAVETVDEMLAMVDCISPAPEPDKDTCTALLATRDGWQQCDNSPGHGTEDHDGGDGGWSEKDHNAIPAVKES